MVFLIFNSTPQSSEIRENTDIIITVTLLPKQLILYIIYLIMEANNNYKQN